VSGLCNQIWHDSKGVACTDYSVMAGCVLGGGTAVNAALWWKPNPVDCDYNFPAGWKSSDMSAATSRVFSRIPGTDHPSADRKIYLQQGYNFHSSALSADGWKNVVPNDVPGSKDMVLATLCICIPMARGVAQWLRTWSQPAPGRTSSSS
jgi:cellobiose dehydrogenase (acceptor)